MKTNNKGIELIKKFESLHDGDLTKIGLQPKQCPVGIWTVGYGRALVNPVTKKFLKGEQDKELAYKMFPNITEDMARLLLQEDLVVFEMEVAKLVKSSINENQFSALVSFAYNVGATNLKNSTLLKKVNANPNDKSISLEFLKWNKAGGKVLNGLVRRREAEASLYLTNI